MEPIAEAVELDEGDLLFEHHHGTPRATHAADACGADASRSDSDAELEDATAYHGRRDQEEADLGEPIEDGSAKSSTLHVSLDEAEEGPEGAAAGILSRPRHIAASMPVTSNMRMGTSLPIAVPPMSRWRAGPGAPAAGPSDSPITVQAATFVPPHQMSVTNDWQFSFTGDSPSIAMKRDRLKARNAILKSTGFLEPGVSSVNNIGLQERNRLAAGGLSQALGNAPLAR